MEQQDEDWKEVVRKGGCERFQNALLECHRRIPAGPARKAGCRHLNRAFSDCLVGVICPSELEAVKSLCSSGGTHLKRSQCKEAPVEVEGQSKDTLFDRSENQLKQRAGMNKV